MTSLYFWPEQLKIKLQEAYAVGGLAAAVEAIPEKKRGTIAVEAHRLGLTKPRPRKNKGQRND